jgi:hypothetical protein
MPSPARGNNNAFFNAPEWFEPPPTSPNIIAWLAREKRREQKERTNKNRLAALRARSAVRQASIKKKAKEIENRFKQRRVVYNTSAHLNAAKMRELGRALDEVKGLRPGTSLNKYKSIRASRVKIPRSGPLRGLSFENNKLIKGLESEWMAEAKQAYKNLQNLRNAIREVRKAKRLVTLTSTREQIRRNKAGGRHINNENAERRVAHLRAQRAARPLFRLPINKSKRN